MQLALGSLQAAHEPLPGQRESAPKPHAPAGV